MKYIQKKLFSVIQSTKLKNVKVSVITKDECGNYIF